jgi:hypothetical protein
VRAEDAVLVLSHAAPVAAVLCWQQVEFPDPRTYFVSSTKGFFNGLLPSLACPNQLTNNQSTLVTSIDLPFTMGCNVKGACALHVLLGAAHP